MKDSSDLQKASYCAHNEVSSSFADKRNRFDALNPRDKEGVPEVSDHGLLANSDRNPFLNGRYRCSG